MNYQDLLNKIDAAKSEIRHAHKLALSNGLSTKERDDLFQKADKKLNTIVKGVYKSLKFENGDYEYVNPGTIPANTNVNTGSVANKLSLVKSSVEGLRDKLKNGRFILINKSTNERFKMNTNTKALFTKFIADVDALIADFVPAQEEEEEEEK